MKRSLMEKCAAVMLTAAITLASLQSTAVLAEKSEAPDDELYTLTYNLDGLDIVIDDEPISSEEAFPPLTAKGGKTVILSSYALEKEGYDFTGWTYDNVVMFEPGDVFVMPDENVVLQPVLADDEDMGVYKVNYNTEGYPSVDKIVATKKNANYPVRISNNRCLRDGFTQIGWTDGTRTFTSSDKIIMPSHDVELYPKWYEMFDVYYEAGDVDNINGAKSVVFNRMETSVFDVANASRLSRSGYTITGWLCDYDNKVYLPVSQFEMPSSEVHFTAVWTPAVYSLTFYSSNDMKQKYPIKAEYNSELVMPECSFRYSGYKFAGWTYKNETYQPGDIFTVPALLSGQSITFGTAWEKDTESDENEVLDVFSMIDARKKYNNEDAQGMETELVSKYVLNNY